MDRESPADLLDRQILDALQQEIPLVLRPYDEIASRLGISPALLLERLHRLRDAGILRGISPVIESRPLGITTATLVALPVPEDRVKDTAALISSYPEVSHNFRRDHHYTLWFTLAARDEGRIQEVLGEILKKTGIAQDTILNLPTVRRIKIDVRFPFLQREEDRSHGPA